MKSAVCDDNWIANQYIDLVAKRGAAIIQMRDKSSAASAASAACDHVHDWIVGSAPGQIISMAVISDGSYDIPKGICFSFPVTCSNGHWKIVQGLKWDENTKARIEITTKELLEERELAFATLN